MPRGSCALIDTASRLPDRDALTLECGRLVSTYIGNTRLGDRWPRVQAPQREVEQRGRVDEELNEQRQPALGAERARSGPCVAVGMVGVGREELGAAQRAKDAFARERVEKAGRVANQGEARSGRAGDAAEHPANAQNTAVALAAVPVVLGRSGGEDASTAALPATPATPADAPASQKAEVTLETGAPIARDRPGPVRHR